MQRSIYVLIVLAVALLIWSCGDDNGDWEEFRDAVMEVQDLQLKVPESEGQNKRVSSVALNSTLGQPGDYYTVTVQMTREVNFHILGMLGWLDDILSYEPTKLEGDKATWGPFKPDAGLSQFEMRVIVEKKADNHFKFSFDVRPKEGGDWKSFYSGENKTTGSTARRGEGYLNIDFDVVAAVDTTSKLRGSLDVTFDTAEGRNIDIVYNQFQDLDENEEPFDATYHYAENADLSGEFRFTASGDIHKDDWGNQYPEKEDWVVTTRWQSEGAGRSDVTATGGDMDATTPPVEKFLISECWGDDFGVTYYTMQVETSTGETYTDPTAAGEESSCVFEEADL